MATPSKIIPYTFKKNQLFTFSLNIDGNDLDFKMVWNMAGNRFYLRITKIPNNKTLQLPVVGSPIDGDINLLSGFFQDSLVFRTDLSRFELYKASEYA